MAWGYSKIIDSAIPIIYTCPEGFPSVSFGLYSPQPQLPEHLCCGQVAAEIEFEACSQVNAIY
jgi:hypothetical protein